MFKYKNPEELEKMSADELKTYHTEMKAFEKKERETEIENATKGIKEEIGTVDKAVKEIAEDVASITEQLKARLSDEGKSMLYKAMKEKHKEFVDAFKGKNSFEISVEKVAAVHMTNNGTVTNASGLTFPTNDNFLIDSDVAYIRIPENYILNVISNTQTDKVPQQVFKRQQVATEGAVAITAEGAVKPLLQYKFQNTATNRQKYAGRIEWTEEFEMDFEALFNDIVRMFERDVLIAWQEGIVDIIDANATAYVSSSLDDSLVIPDNGLAIVAVAQQIRALNYTPNFVIMNPVDVDAAVYTQDSEGRFMLKPYIDPAGNRIAGIRLITSNRVTPGTFLVGDFSVYRERHSRYIFRTGYYDDQFIRNEWSAIGEVFSILSIAPIDYKAIVKGNFATVKAALQKPEGA